MAFRLSTHGALFIGLAMAAPQLVTSKPMAGFHLIDAWMNPTATGQTVGAGYLTIVNRTDRADALVDASSLAASVVQMHTISLSNGVSRMRQVSRLNLPASGTLTLAPGGSHLMFLGLKKPLIPGQKILVKLRFASGKQQTVVMAIKAASQRNQTDGEHHVH